MALQIKLKGYAQLKGTAFRVAINNHILQQAAEIAIAIEENEIKNCWTSSAFRAPSREGEG